MENGSRFVGCGYWEKILWTNGVCGIIFARNVERVSEIKVHSVNSTEVNLY